MISNPAIALALFASSCGALTHSNDTEAPPTLPAKAPCTAEVVLLQSWDSPLNCDVTPPQMLVIRVDETRIDFDRCADAGGRLMHDDEIPAWYCLNIDY